MGRSKQREIGAIIVENKKRDLAGLIKILLMKGKKGKMDVTLSAVLEIEEGNENDKKYHKASIVPPVTTSPNNEQELIKDQGKFTIKLMDYLERKGFSLYY